MSLATAELPADPEALRAFAPACQGALKAAETAVQVKALEIEKLKFQIAKLRRMQWTKRGAHLLLQIRTRVLDGTLRPLFERWYPGLANDNVPAGQAAAAA